MRKFVLEIKQVAVYELAKICLETRQIAIEIFYGILDAIIKAMFER